MRAPRRAALFLIGLGTRFEFARTRRGRLIDTASATDWSEDLLFFPTEFPNPC